MQQAKRTLSVGLMVISALSALVCSTAVQAQGAADYSLYGAGSGYVGLNVGQSNYALGSSTNRFSSDSNATAFNVYTGSYFSPNFGFELGYTHFGTASRGGGDTRAEGINLSLVARAPLSQQFNVLGKLGTTYGRTDVSAVPGSGLGTGRETGFGVSYGIGAEYAFTNQVSGVLQYDEHRLRVAGEGRDRISATTVGLRYRF